MLEAHGLTHVEVLLKSEGFRHVSQLRDVDAELLQRIGIADDDIIRSLLLARDEDMKDSKENNDTI